MAAVLGVMAGVFVAHIRTNPSREHALSPRQGPQIRQCEEAHLQTTTPRLEGYLLLIFVDSRMDDHQLREASRSTWLAAWNSDRVHKFVIATRAASQEQLGQLACENEQYGDLLLLPAISEDHAFSASDKILGACAWAASTNISFSYVFKCDGTTFVDLRAIVDELNEAHVHQAEESLLWGFFAGNVTVEDPGKWRLCDTYLPYPEGGGYIASWDLMQLLLFLADDLERFPRDDVAMGVWLAPFAHIRRRHDVRFNTGQLSRGCSNKHVMSSGETPLSMAQKEERLETLGETCAEEYRARPSYIYNWSAPADKCCIMSDDIP